jgi:hypothetical protein
VSRTPHRAVDMTGTVEADGTLGGCGAAGVWVHSAHGWVGRCFCAPDPGAPGGLPLPQGERRENHRPILIKYMRGAYRLYPMSFCTIPSVCLLLSFWCGPAVPWV